MSKEKLLKIWKVTKTIIIPLTIALADVLFWAKAMTDPTWLILYPRHIATGCICSAGFIGCCIYADIKVSHDQRR
jgi:hypothetical protein